MGSTTSKLASPMASITYLAGIIGFSVGSLARVLTIWMRKLSSGDEIGILTDQQRDHVQSEVDSMRQALDRKTEELASLLQEKKMLSGDMTAKDERLGVLEEELSKAKRQLEELGETLEQSKNRNQVLDEELQHRVKELETTATELERERGEHDDTRALLEPSNLSSKSQPDTSSTAEIISMMEALNTEMLHTAAHIADAFEFDDVQSWTDEYSAETQEVCARVKNLVGDQMMQLLRSTPHNEDPTIIQITLQGCLVVYAEWVIGTWHNGEPSSDIESLLVNLFETVREEEVQAVSGKWRSLTRRHLRQMVSQESDPSSIVVPHIVDAVCDVLISARCRSNRTSTKNLMHSKFSKEMEAIVKSALRMNKAIGEDIISKDLEPMHEQPGVTFDPLTMDDAFPADGTKNEEKRGRRALCSTDLGLRSVVKVSGEGDGESEWHDSMLLKPKVALESLLEAMSTPIEPVWANVQL